MQQFTVTGMSCAACAARVEKAVNKVEGVSACSVSLLTNSMGVEGTADAGAIIKAVEDAGYGAAPKGGAGEAGSGNGADRSARSGDLAALRREEREALEDHETPKLLRRLLTSLGFLLVLMYFSMGHMMWGFPIPAFFEGNHIAIGLLELLLALTVMLINNRFFTSGFKALLHRAPNMDTLVALGSGVSFAYSTVRLFAMTAADHARQMEYMDDLYFESAAMIVTLITVGKMLESMSKGRTTNALKALMDLQPETAVLLRDGQEVTVPIGAVRTDDIYIVRPGDRIPVDGIVVSGMSAVNEAALTGESIPVDKAEGDGVSAATINQSGVLQCRATRVGEDTTLSQIIRMVSDAAATKAPIAKIADKVSGIFVPAVIGIAVLVFIIWTAAGAAFPFSLSRAIAVLVISCPCALGLATPVAIMVGNGMGAKNGILFKTSAALEETGRIGTVVLDKTGTITKGEPEVTDILVFGENGDAPERRTDFIRKAVSLEEGSEHPLAKAIVRYAQENGIAADPAEQFRALPGNGVEAILNGHRMTGGSGKFMRESVFIPADVLKSAEAFAEEGKTPLYFAEDGKLLGLIAVADVIREDTPEAIEDLKNLGIRVVMLTGDNERTARAIAAKAGVEHVIAGVLPDGKAGTIELLKKQEKVAMVGDGINDAPALTTADIGIAIGAGADVAVDAADVVIAKNTLRDAAAAIRLSRATLRNIHENLFWAFFYNVICIPLAAGAWYHSFGISLSPMIGAAAMSLSSFCVVMNALRLNLTDIYKRENDRPVRGHAVLPLPEELAGTEDTPDAENGTHGETENKTAMEDVMTKTIEIKGMMCMHCEATVKKALLAVPGVADADVSHERGNAIVTLTEEVADDVLSKAVTDKDYEVISIA